MEVISFDTETFLIGKDAVVPKMVCASISTAHGSHLVGNGDDDVLDVLRSLFDPGHLLAGHYVSYDCAVVALSYPELERLIWSKYAAGEIVCTMLQEQLINLGTHGKLKVVRLPDGTTKQLRYSLDVLENRYLGIDRSAQKTGDHNWRMNYHLLDGKRADEYPDDAAQYAIDDAVGTRQVYFEQIARAPAGVLDTASWRAWADFALFLITERGMAIDPVEVRRVQEKLAEDLNPEKLMPLVDAGVLRAGELPRPHSRSLAKAAEILGKDEAPDNWTPYRVTLEAEGIKFTDGKKPSVNKKALQERVVRLCNEHDMEIKLTEKGAVCCDSEVITDLEGLDEVIEVYGERQSLQKLVTTEIPRMMWEGEIADVVHFPFNALLETGRTSSYAKKFYPSGNGQQLHPLIRPCYVARPGHVLLSTDYSTLELATVGQCMIDLFGSSVHADKINAGQDLHAFLAARLAFELSPDFRLTCDDSGITTNDGMYEAFMACKGHVDLGVFFKWWRKFSKPVGLGYPGALGPWTFLAFAKKTYGVNVAEIAAGLDESQFQVTDYLLSICKAKLHVAPAEFKWTPQTKAVALAIKLKDIWLDTFKMRPYYEYINNNHKDPMNPVIGKTKGGKPITGYTYTSDFGMVRRACSYTAACNGLSMQTPAAEGALTAVIQVTRACRDEGLVSRPSMLYGKVHPLDFVHDEIITEHIEGSADELHEQAQEVSRLMLEAMSIITPDVPGLGTEGVYMRCWDKFAEPTFDSAGRLIVTEPATTSS